jgi:hypothetical protein
MMLQTTHKQRTHWLLALLPIISACIAPLFSMGGVQGQEKKPEREVVIQPISPVQGQEKEATKWNAGQFPSFGLGDVAIVKIVEKEEEKRVSILLNGYDQNLATRSVRVTEMIAQKRTRAVQKDGKEQVQTYTVMVPVIKNRMIVQSNPTPQNSRHFEFAISEVRIWNIDGELLGKDAIESLSGARHIFLVTLRKGKQFKLDPYYASVLREDVLFVEANVPKPIAKPVLPPAAARIAPAARAFRLAPARAANVIRAVPAKKAIQPKKIEKQERIEKPVEP